MYTYIPTIQYAIVQYTGTGINLSGIKSINTLAMKYVDTL